MYQKVQLGGGGDLYFSDILRFQKWLEMTTQYLRDKSDPFFFFQTQTGTFEEMLVIFMVETEWKEYLRVVDHKLCISY